MVQRRCTRRLRVLPGGRIESYGHTLEGKQQVVEIELVISAKAAAPSLTPAEAKAMVRTLLEERFQLRWRLQPRDVDGYLLMPAREDGRPGQGLRPFAGDCDARANYAAVPFESPDYEQKARCNWTGMMGRQRAVGVTMMAIAQRLTSLMATPVSDRTGWPGPFTFDVIAGTDGMPIQAVVMRTATGRGSPLPVDAP